MDEIQLSKIVEALLMVSGEPLSMGKLVGAFDEHERPNAKQMQVILQSLASAYEDRPIALNEVASGYCIQIRPEYEPWVTRLLQRRPQRLSRALLETLAIIAYQQPITRAEIEQIRGVSLHTSILKNLLGKFWIQIIGKRETPGRPTIYGTTRKFLDHFNLKSLSELPALIQADETEETAVS